MVKRKGGDNTVHGNRGMLTRSKTKENAPSKIRKLETDPLKIPNILEEIFSFLDADSIKNARQLNKFWSVEGAKALISKCFVKIPSDLKLMGQESSLSSGTSQMMFKDFLAYKSNEVSMIPSICIKAVGDFEMWKSFGVLGPQVKSLKLTVIEDEEDWFSNLFDLLPNLKQLSFGVTTEKYVIEKILGAVMSKFEKDKNGNQTPLLVSLIPVDPKSAAEFEELEKLSNCNKIVAQELTIKLKPNFFRTVNNLQARITNILEKLLETSKNILEKIALYDYQLYLSLLQFPCMTKLTQMKLQYDNEVRPHGFVQSFDFPPSFRFSENVPNLENIDIKHDEIENLFEHAGKAPSVKSFKYSNCTDLSTMQYLFKIFPNAEEVDIVEYSGETFQSIFENGKNLRKLRINLDMSTYGDHMESDDLDTIFTGFPSWTVEMLKNNPNWTPYPAENLEKLRDKNSLLNLKELRELRVDFFHTDRPRHIPKMMLRVSGEYVFKRLPKLTKIVVGARDIYPEWAAELAEQLPYVTIE